MKLYAGTNASFSLDARDINGQKIDAKLIEAATYTLTDGFTQVVKTLADGLRIEYSDNLGQTVIYVDLSAVDTRNFSSRCRQCLSYSLDGVNFFGASLRVEFIDVVNRN